MENTEKLHKLLDLMLSNTPVKLTENKIKEATENGYKLNPQNEYPVIRIEAEEKLVLYNQENDEVIYDVYTDEIIF